MQRKACPTSSTGASVADRTKPLLFRAADGGPQGENLKVFNKHLKPPGLHDHGGSFLSLPCSNWGLGGCQCGHARITGENKPLATHYRSHGTDTHRHYCAEFSSNSRLIIGLNMFPCVAAIKGAKHGGGNRSRVGWFLSACRPPRLHRLVNKKKRNTTARARAPGLNRKQSQVHCTVTA